MKNIIVAAMAIVGMSGTTTAIASDDGFYIFGALGNASGGNFQSFMDSRFLAYSSNVNIPSVIKMNLGYQISGNFAIEGGYLDLSDQKYIDNYYDTASNSVSGWDVKAVGILPVSYPFSLLGKLGIADISSSIKIPFYSYGGGSYGTSSKTSVTYGLGAKFDLSRVSSIRLDWDSYDSDINVGDGITPIVSSRFNVWTIGLAFVFN